MVRIAYWLTVDRHGLRPRDDNTHFVIARRERERGTRQSIVSKGERTGLSLRLLAHSGSPRAYALAMTRWGGFTMKGVK
jgi:hypothetical protein